MNNFDSFNLLPNGVIIFKANKIKFINKHLLDVLNINFLNHKHAVETILKTLSIKDENKLLIFFTSYEYFQHNKKLILVEHNRYDKLDIFSFTLLPKVLHANLNKLDKEVEQKADIDTEVAKFFKINDIKKLEILTFYKGLPLKNYGKIIRINKDIIDIEVDFKHHISLLNRDDVILIANTKRGELVVHGHVFNSYKSIFSISNFSLCKEDMHLRKGIRIKPTKDMFVNVKQQIFKLYDISQNGISIVVDSTEDENYFKKISSMVILFDTKKVFITVKYLKTIYDDEKILKVIFLILSADENGEKIQEYLYKQQNLIIREIHNYIGANINSL